MTISNEQFEEVIREECGALADLLVEKNRFYNNAILNSPSVFSKSTPLDRCASRADDKIARLMANQVDDMEDAELDLIGYLILMRALRTVLGDETTTPVAETTKAKKKPTVKAQKNKKAETKTPESISGDLDLLDTPEPDEPEEKEMASVSSSGDNGSLLDDLL